MNGLNGHHPPDVVDPAPGSGRATRVIDGIEEHWTDVGWVPTHPAKARAVKVLDLTREQRVQAAERFLEAKHATLWSTFDVSNRARRRAAAEWMVEEFDAFAQTLQDEVSGDSE